MDVQPVQAQGVVRVVLVNSCAWHSQAGKELIPKTAGLEEQAVLNTP